MSPRRCRRFRVGCVALVPWLTVAVAGPREKTGAGDLAGLILLPPLVSPGEELELRVLDPRRAPLGGRWTIGGAVARQEGEVLRVRLPETLRPGEPLPVSYQDPGGVRALDVARAEGVRVVPPGPGPTTPRIRDCAARAFVNDVACVCGSFPPGSWDGLSLDGKPARRRAGAGRRVVYLQLPPDLTPGAHVIGGDPAYGYPIADQFVLSALRVRAAIDREALFRGQRGKIELEVEGTEDSLPFRLTNGQPGVVSLDGGDRQTAFTSGGSPNRLERRLRGIRRGDFQIEYALDLPPCGCAGEPAWEPGEEQSRSPFLPGRVLVLVRLAGQPAMEAVARAVAAAHGLLFLEVHSLPTIGSGLVVLAARDVPVAVESLRKDPRVLAAQPDLAYETVGAVAETTGRGRGTTGQDAPAPLGPDYGRRLIRADRLPPSAGGEGVKLAIIDSGVDGDHVDLAGRVAERIDVTGRGFTPDIHGTLIAGIIAATPANGRGIDGVAPRVRLLSIKACQPDSARAVKARCSTATLVRAVDIAVQKAAHVLNLSVAGTQDDLLDRILQEAMRRGIVVVAAAGHLPPGSPPPFPASLEGVFAVTAVDVHGEPYAHATRGDFVDLSAPGVEILSTVPGHQFAVFSGTSAAAAFVSGAAAVLVLQPGTDPRQLLKQTAKDLGPPGRDSQFGSGLLDACEAAARAARGRWACGS